VSTSGRHVGENWGFSPLKFLAGTYERPIGYNQFQNIPRGVAKVHKNRSRDVEKSVDGKKMKTRVNIHRVK